MRWQKGCRRIFQSPAIGAARCGSGPIDRRPGAPLWAFLLEGTAGGALEERTRDSPFRAPPAEKGIKTSGETSQQSGCARKSATFRRRGMELAAPLTETARAEAAEAQRRDS